MKTMATLYEDKVRGLAYNKGDDQPVSLYKKGVVDDWRTHFTEEMSKKMDERIDKYFGAAGLVFKYD